MHIRAHARTHRLRFETLVDLQSRANHIGLEEREVVVVQNCVGQMNTALDSRVERLC